MMRKALLLSLSLLVLLLLPSLGPPPGKASVEITFTGLRNSKGNMVMGVSNTAEGWPRNALMEKTWKKTNGQSSRLTVKLEDLDYGDYALSVLDDENSNGDMDTFLGIPKEGYGFTRDPKVRLSAPDFEDCVIQVNKPLVRVEIPIHYFQKDKEEK